MADEINKLFFETVKNDEEFADATGQTSTDPRIYKFKTPVRLAISADQPAYAVYRRMGTTNLPSGAKINFGQISDQSYSLEVFAQTDVLVEEICSNLEDLFYEANFFTENFKIGYTRATRGSLDFDDGRQLWLETMSIFFTKIIKLVTE